MGASGLLATLLLGSDGLASMPLVIVAVAVAYVASARLTASPRARCQREVMSTTGSRPYRPPVSGGPVRPWSPRPAGRWARGRCVAMHRAGAQAAFPPCRAS